MLTHKQLQLLVYIDQHLRDTGCSPSFEDMKQALALKSKAGIHRLIGALEEREFITRLHRHARALHVVHLPEFIVAPTARPTAGDAPRHAVPSVGPHQTRRRILVVDDTADVLVAIGAFLMADGYVIVSAADGTTALQLIASDPQIGILITDFAMPGLSGVELIDQATQMRPDLKVLLITGYPHADGLAELPSHITVLTKPFRRDALITQVKNLVRELPPMVAGKALELFENRQG